MCVLGFVIMLGMIVVNVIVQIVVEYGGGLNCFSLVIGSLGEFGLFKVLGEVFGKDVDVILVWVKVGIGQLLNLFKDKKVDMVMVYVLVQVDKVIVEGWVMGKKLIGFNEFYIVGLVSDLVGIFGVQNVVDVFCCIVEVRVKFVLCGDNFGMYQKEMQIWGKVGIVFMFFLIVVF